MMKAESMKKEAMQYVEMENMKAISYGNGYSEGYSDGYDKALENVHKLVEKHSWGAKEKELKPATKFLHIGQYNQLEKIGEEYQEVVDAFRDGGNEEHLAEELADMQQACETMLAIMGLTESERREVRMKVIQKNSLRGYYMPPNEKYGD